MLGPDFRLSVFNSSGVSQTVVIEARFWKFASDGSIEFDTADVQLFNSSVSSSTTAWTNGSNQNNRTNKWMGAEITVRCTWTGTATGTVKVDIQRSTDDGTTWPTNGYGEPIGGRYFNAETAATSLFNLAIY